MTSTAPNWLAIIGLVYCGVGVALITAAIGSALTVAGAGDGARARHGASQAYLASLGAALTIAGFVMQASAATTTLPLGGAAALMLLGLMATMIIFGIARFAYIGGDSEETAMESDERPAVIAAPVAAPTPEKLATTVKLVSVN